MDSRTASIVAVATVSTVAIATPVVAVGLIVAAPVIVPSFVGLGVGSGCVAAASSAAGVIASYGGTVTGSSAASVIASYGGIVTASSICAMMKSVAVSGLSIASKVAAVTLKGTIPVVIAEGVQHVKNNHLAQRRGDNVETTKADPAQGNVVQADGIE